MTSWRSTIWNCRTPPVSWPWTFANLKVVKWKCSNAGPANQNKNGWLRMQTACGKECSTALRIDASRQMAASVSVVSSSIFCWEKKWWPNQLSPFTTVSKSSPTSWRSSERRHFGPLCVGIVEIECWYCVTWLPTRRVGWPLIIKNVQQIIEIRARYANLGLLQVRIIFSSGKAWRFLEFQQVF